nr:MFS transporter [Brevibacillus fulvus]
MTRSVTIWVLMSTMFLTNIGFGIILPTLPFLSQHLGASTFEMGLAMSVFAGASLVASSIWGGVSDRIGRRPVLILGIVGYGVSSALLAFAPSVAVLLILRFLSGLMSSAVYPSSMALVTECTAAQERARILGYMGSINGIGFICGPPLGAFLSLFGIQVPFVSVGLLSIINGLLALYLLPRTSKTAVAAQGTAELQVRWLQRFRHMLQNRMIAPLLFGTFALSLADASISTTLSYFVTGSLRSTPTMAGWAFMINAGVSAVAQATVFSRIFHKCGEVGTIVIGMICGMIGYLAMGLSQLLIWAFLALAVLSFGRGLSYPSITTGISLHTAPQLQGSMFGSQGTVGSLGRTLGPLLAGWLYSVQERSPFFFSGGLLMLTAAIFLLFYLTRMKAKKQQAEG